VVTVHVFVAASTQWRVGVAGPTGLDYGALAEVMRMMAVPRRDWFDVFDGIRIMESAALEVMRKN
jgi:hypothetical protein